jgi:hypothetical protein
MAGLVPAMMKTYGGRRHVKLSRITAVERLSVASPSLKKQLCLARFGRY